MDKKVYCLYGQTGHENYFIRDLQRMGYTAFSPFVEKIRPTKDGTRVVRTRLLPGYVFFEGEEEPTWREVHHIDYVYRLLTYGDDTKALHGKDLEFVNWVRRHEGTIEVTKVIKEGTKIRFVAGPLCDMDVKVLKVNKSRHQVQVAVGSENSVLSTMWCAIEYLQDNADLDKLMHDEQEEKDESKN